MYKFYIQKLLYILAAFFFVAQATAQVFCEDILGNDCNTCPDYKVAANPNLFVDCGSPLKMVFIVDESNSIWISGVEQEVANGVNAFLQELACTSVEIVIIEFGSVANFVVDTYTPVADIVSGMQDYFNEIPFNNQIYSPNPGGLGGTNWQAALLQANTLPDADIVLFLTDGLPTTYSPDAAFPESSFDYCGDGTTTQEAEIYNPVQLANNIKNQGSHMFVMGVGDVNTNYIVDISGPDEFGEEFSIDTADYFFEEDFSSFIDSFVEVANSFCPLIGSIETSNSCEGSANGSMVINLNTNIAGPFSFSLNDNPSQITDNHQIMIENLTVGTHNLQVQTLDDDCSNSVIETISIESIPLPTLTLENASICEENKNGIDLNSLITSNGTITVFTTPENAETNSNPLQNLNVNPLNETTYYVRSEDAITGCVTFGAITIFVNSLPSCSVTDSYINCNSPQGATQLNAITDVSNAAFVWTTINGNIVSGANTAAPIVNESGTYIVTITDLDTGCNNSCMASVSANMHSPEVSINPVDTLCNLHDALQLNAFPNGGEFYGDNVTSNGIFQATEPGIYTVTYSYTNPENGCEGTTSIVIEVENCCSDETAFAYNEWNATCFPGVIQNTNNFYQRNSNHTQERSRRWGWSNGPLTANLDYTFQLIAGAGQCRLNNGIVVGEVFVSYSDTGDMHINYILNEQTSQTYYQLESVHVYLGCDQFPEQLAPGQMPYTTSSIDGFSAEIIIPESEISAFNCTQFYFIAHAEVRICSTSTFAEKTHKTEEDLFDKSTFSVYPVPFEESVTVACMFNYDTSVTVEVVDIQGRVVFSSESNNYKKGFPYSLNISLNPENKILFVRVKTAKESHIKKILSGK